MSAAGELRADEPSTAGRLRQLLHLLGPERRLIGLAVASGIGHQVVVLASATAAAWLVGRSIMGDPGHELVSGLVLLGLLTIPVTAMPWLESFLAHVAAFRVLADIRGRLFDALERLAPGYVLERRSGELGAIAIADVELLERFFAHALSPLIVATAVPLAAIIGLGTIHWSLAAALLPVLVLLLSVPAWLRRQAAVQGDRLRSRIGELNAKSVDLLQGMVELISFGGREEQLRLLGGADDALATAKVDHSRRAGLEHAATDALTAIGLVVGLAMGAVLVSRGTIDPALYPVAVILSAASLLPVATVLDVVRDLNLAAAAAGRVLSIVGAPAPVAVAAGAAPAQPIEPHVAFEKVGFRYAADSTPAVRDVSFEIRPGETVALVGHSGAGKTTLSRLLLRLWDVEEGTVRVGGHDVRCLPQEVLRETVALVPQDVYLFNTTLRENIRLGAPEANDRAVEAAARAALAHPFIAELPAGYDTPVGELGGRLSGGQRQRIAIARALLVDAPILVMDEAVSNLDAASEEEVAAAMAGARAGRTSMIIAHRLSTIRAADRLVVLEGGRAVEQGTHEELIARGGAYARLMSSQLSNDAPADQELKKNREAETRVSQKGHDR